MLDKILKSMVTEKVEVRVGKVDLDLVNKLNDIKETHKNAHKEIQERISKFVEKIKAEHKPICDDLNLQEQQVWDQILASVGIPEENRELEYSINHLTGIVSRIDKKVNPKFEEIFSAESHSNEGPVH